MEYGLPPTAGQGIGRSFDYAVCERTVDQGCIAVHVHEARVINIGVSSWMPRFKRPNSVHNHTGILYRGFIKRNYHEKAMFLPVFPSSAFYFTQFQI